MKRSINLTLRLVSVLIFLFVLGFVNVNAQIDEVEQKRRRVAARTRTIVQTKIKVVKVPEIKYQKISGVTITTVQPNAGIELESINLKKQTKWTKSTNSNGVLNLENVPPGKYLLTVSLKGFISEESEIEVKPAQLVTVPVNLEPITHDIFITTNVPNGEVRYAPIQRQAGGAKDVGEYCTVRIKNGNAALLQMREGDYSLEVRSDEVEYGQVAKEITVSGGNAAQNNEISIKLERKISTEDFLANWLPNEWRLPAGWRIENKRMQANGAGVALLQNERFNHYKDFELKTNIRSLDNKSVGFVLRARDDKNYYLIEITGSASGQPYFLTGYVVKNGKAAETLVRTNIQAYAKTLADRKFFNIIISGKGNVFKVTLEDVETGRPFVIGIVEDQNNTFPIGAIGVGAKEASRFDVNLFNINYR
jgi:hypothetical protein